MRPDNHFFHYLLCKIGSRFSIVQATFQIHLSKGWRPRQIVCQLSEKKRKAMIFMSWKLWELLIWWASGNLRIFHALGVHYVRSVFPCSRLSFSVGMFLNKSGTGAKIFMHLFLFNYIETVTATTVFQVPCTAYCISVFCFGRSSSTTVNSEGILTSSC